MVFEAFVLFWESNIEGRGGVINRSNNNGEHNKGTSHDDDEESSDFDKFVVRNREQRTRSGHDVGEWTCTREEGGDDELWWERNACNRRSKTGGRWARYTIGRSMHMNLVLDAVSE